MIKHVPLCVTLAVASLLPVLSELPTHESSSVDELPKSSLVVFEAGGELARVAVDSPRVVFVGESQFIKGIVSDSAATRAKSVFPTGSTMLIRVESIVWIQSLPEKDE